MEFPESLLGLANHDVKGSGESDFFIFIRDFCSFWEHVQSDHPAIKASQKYKLYMEGLPELSDAGVMKERRKYFAQLQAHLHELLLGTMAANENDGAVNPVIEMTCKYTLVIDPATKEYVEKFEPNKDLTPGDALDLKGDKLLLDLAFVELVKKEGLVAGRFKRCEKCSKIFYQPTAKDRQFCSTYCGGVTRQAKHKEKIDQKKGKSQ